MTQHEHFNESHNCSEKNSLSALFKINSIIFLTIYKERRTALNEKQTSKPSSPYDLVMNLNTKLLECGFESVMTIISWISLDKAFKFFSAFIFLYSTPVLTHTYTELLWSLKGAVCKNT